MSAICLLVENSLSDKALLIPGSEAWWQPALDNSLKHRDVTVQESAARVMAAVSRLRLCNSYVTGAVKEFPKATPTAQQGFSRTLGFLDYVAFPHGIELATDVLVNALTVGVCKIYAFQTLALTQNRIFLVPWIFEEHRDTSKCLLCHSSDYIIIAISHL